MKMSVRTGVLAILFVVFTSCSCSVTVNAQSYNPEVISLHNQAVRKLNDGDSHGALKDLNEVIRLDPGNQLAMTNRMKAKYAIQDYGGVISDYKELRKLHLDRLSRSEEPYPLPYVDRVHAMVADSYAKLGVHSEQAGNLEAAIAFYNEAILQSSEIDAMPDYYHLRGKAKQKLGDADGANKDFALERSLRHKSKP